MLEEQIANLLWFCGALAVLWAFWRWVLGPTLTDLFRMRIFELRRELFLFAHDSGIGLLNHHKALMFSP